MSINKTTINEVLNDLKNKKFLTNILVILLAIAIFVSAIYFLAIWDTNKDKYTSEPSSEAMTKILVATATDKETQFSDNEINDFIAYLIQKRPIKRKDIEISNIFIDLSENKINFYIRIKYKKRDFGITTSINAELNSSEGTLELNPYNTKVGKLPIPSRLISTFISNQNYKSVQVVDDKIVLPNAITLNVDNSNFNIEFKQLRVSEQKLFIKTSGSLEDIKRYLNTKLGNILGNDEIIEKWIGDISNNIGDFLKNLT